MTPRARTQKRKPPQVGRTARNEEAVMAIGVDNDPSAEILKEISDVKGVLESTLFKELGVNGA